jgi:hypothetical protein
VTRGLSPPELSVHEAHRGEAHAGGPTVPLDCFISPVRFLAFTRLCYNRNQSYDRKYIGLSILGPMVSTLRPAE